MDLGANENGQLGIGTTTNVNAPVQVAGLSGIKAISGGLGYHGMVLTENGSVWTWGKMTTASWAMEREYNKTLRFW